MLPYLNNIGDYFAANYVAEGFAKEALDKAGYDKETQEGYRKDLLRLRKVYFDYRTDYQRAGNRRRKDLIKRTHEWHNALLSALGYDVRATPYEFVDTKRDGVVPIRKIYRGADGAPQLFLMEMRSELRRGGRARRGPVRTAVPPAELGARLHRAGGNGTDTQHRQPRRIGGLLARRAGAAGLHPAPRRQ